MFQRSVPKSPAARRNPAMDLDIEMDVDDVQDAPVPALPQAYTHDIITGEEQVRIGDRPAVSPSAMR